MLRVNATVSHRFNKHRTVDYILALVRKLPPYLSTGVIPSAFAAASAARFSLRHSPLVLPIIARTAASSSCVITNSLARGVDTLLAAPVARDPFCHDPLESIVFIASVELTPLPLPETSAKVRIRRETGALQDDLTPSRAWYTLVAQFFTWEHAGHAHRCCRNYLAGTSGMYKTIILMSHAKVSTSLAAAPSRATRRKVGHRGRCLALQTPCTF